MYRKRTRYWPTRPLRRRSTGPVALLATMLATLAVVAVTLVAPPQASATAEADEAAPAAPSWPTLRQGSYGWNVRTLQLLLQKRGYFIASDSLFGPATTRAVNDFKRKHGWPADGVVGSRVWEAVVFRVEPGMSGKHVAAAKVQLNKVGVRPWFDPSTHHYGQRMRDVVSWIKGLEGMPRDGVIATPFWRHLLAAPAAYRLPVPRNSVTHAHLGRLHHTYPAIDIMVRNVPAYAAMAGTVSHFSSETCGIGIRLDLGNDVRMNYCHLSRRTVANGQRVTAGTQIGVTGDTGNARGNPHLHFEIRLSGGELRCPQRWLQKVYYGRTPPTLASLPARGCF